MGQTLLKSPGWDGVSGWLSWLTSDFRSGHDLTVRGFEPRMGLSAVSTEPALDPLYPLSLPLLLALSLSLSLSLSPLKHK